MEARSPTGKRQRARAHVNHGSQIVAIDRRRPAAGSWLGRCYVAGAPLTKGPMPRLTSSLLLSLVALLALPLGAAAQDFDTSGEQSMLARINAMRAADGLAPLDRDQALDAAARAHCVDMAAQRQLTHVSESSGTPADRVSAAGVEAQTIAENVALHRTAEEAHQALLASDAHRANMMGPSHTHVGIAALRSDHGVYVTQVFAALPQPEAAPPEAPPAEVVPAMPAPSVEESQPEVLQAPPPAAPAPVFAPQLTAPQTTAPQARAPQAPQPQAAPQAPQPQATYAAQAGSGGTVVIERRAGRVAAYWVYGSGRWWYYPMPPGAQPGQQLQVDRSVQGPPPGFPAHPRGQAQAQPAPRPAAPYATPYYPQPQPYVQPPPRGGTVITIVPPVGGYYAPPPPYTGPPSRAWRRAQRRWERSRRRWLQQQRRVRRRAL